VQLVTTALDSLQDKDKDQHLLLGAWCHAGDNSNKLEVLPYHWDDRQKYYNDYLYLNEVYESVLTQYSSIMNKIHGVEKSRRYWRILIGPWLRFFIDALYDRFETVRIAKESGLVTDTILRPYSLDDWAPRNFNGFFSELTEDTWNHVVFAECLQFQEFLVQIDCSSNKLKPKNTQSTPGGRYWWIRRLIRFYQKLIPDSLNRVAILFAVAMPSNLVKLQVSLRQIPYLLGPEINNVDLPVNKEIRKLLIIDGGCGFDAFLRNMIPYFMPKSYLESYSFLKAEVMRKYPKKPRVIYTDYGYQAMDSFKLWAAEYVEQGVSYYIGQHGGNMGFSGWNQPEDHQKKSADKYLSWGWKDSTFISVQPMPSMKISGMRIRHQNSGDIVHVMAAFPRYFYTHYSIPVAGQYLEYLDDQVRFLNTVDERLIGSVRIRPESTDYGWSINSIFKDAGFEDRFDVYQGRLTDRLQGCRLCIVTHNATVMLETLSANFPTLIYWNPEFNEIRQSGKRWVDELKRVGILHESPVNAANHLNMIGEDVESWWKTPDLQEVRAAFVQRYAYNTKDWLSNWKKFLGETGKK